MVETSVDDKRLFGEMSVIHDNAGHVLVYVDKSKREMSSMVGPLNWWSSELPVLNFPAGGRKTNHFGYEETFLQTSNRELDEETRAGLEEIVGPIKGRVFLPRRNKQSGAFFEKQFFPFVAAQLKPDHINQIGVTSAFVAFDSFSRESKKIIQMRIDNNLAYWIKLQDIYQALMDGDSQNVEFHGLKVRPQMFTAAFIWESERLGIDQQRTKFNIIGGNRELIHRVKEESTQTGIEIRNGSFQQHGEVSTLLTARDRQFILGK